MKLTTVALIKKLMPHAGIMKYERKYAPIKTGIEYEIEMFNPYESNIGYGDNTTWKWNKDPSLKLDGMELTTIGTVTGPDIKYHLADLELQLSNVRQDLLPSHRCSIHIHLNVAGVTINKIREILMLGIALDPVLFSYISPERAGNSFSTPISHQNNKFQQLMEGGKEGNKYTSISTCRINNLGTIEYRHMQTTLDLTRIADWIEVLHMIHTYALNNPVPDLITPLNRHSEYSILTEKVFPNHLEMQEAMRATNPDELQLSVSAAKYLLV